MAVETKNHKNSTAPTTSIKCDTHAMIVLVNNVIGRDTQKPAKRSSATATTAMAKKVSEPNNT